MKVSELIVQLQRFEEQYGDLAVYVHDPVGYNEIARLDYFSKLQDDEQTVEYFCDMVV